MKRVAGLILMMLAIGSALWSAKAQQAPSPGDQPVDPNIVAAAAIQAAADQAEPATQESDDSSTQPTTESTTEPTTQDVEEPTTGSSTMPSVKHFSRTTTRPSGKGAVRWSHRGSNPTTAAATTLPAQRPMSNEYVILQTKSIFVKGHAADTSRSTPNGGGLPSTNPTTLRPEGSLVFNGVTDTNGETMALIEDSATGHTTAVRIGDAVAAGKIKSITFDALEYEAAGKVITVKLGQNFEGTAVSGVAAPTESTTVPSDSAAGDIIERMRRKRAAEMGGG